MSKITISDILRQIGTYVYTFRTHTCYNIVYMFYNNERVSMSSTIQTCICTQNLMVE